MKRIYKYPLELVSYQSVKIPEDHEILGIRMQNGIPVLYAMVNPEDRLESIDISMIGTGHNISIDYDGTYISTVEDLMGLVWHFFIDNI